MLKKIIGILLAASIFVSSFTIPVMAEETEPETGEQNVSETQDSALTDDSSEENKEPELPADPPPVETQPEEPNTDEETGEKNKEETIPDVPDKTTDEIPVDSDVTGEEKKEEETTPELPENRRNEAVSLKSDTDVAYPVTEGNIYFDKATGTITGYDGEIAEVIIPCEIEGSTVTAIRDNAFAGCNSLVTIEIPNGVTSIERSAFNGCTSLTSITIPNTVTRIAQSCFTNCTSLKNITLPNNLSSIDYGLFFNCTSLENIIIPGTVTDIGSHAFINCTSLTDMEIPDNVTTIGSFAFYNCESLTHLTISDNLISIKECAFNGCISLKYVYFFGTEVQWRKIDIVENVLDENGDASNNSLTSATILFYDDIVVAYPVTGGNLHFDKARGIITGCDGKITEVIIPDTIDGITVTSIGSLAFHNCSSLTSITIPDSITSIGSSAFEGCSSLTSITIPDSVISIEDWTFNECNSLTSIIIPDSVISIGNYTFWMCTSLASIKISDNVTSIGDAAFGYCLALRSAEIPYGVTSLGHSAFDNCNSLTSIIIPSSVTSIGNFAFRDCSVLTSITIPDSVTSIGSSAFYNCTSLTDIYYSGTEDQWSNIDIGYHNDFLKTATIHYNSKGPDHEITNETKVGTFSHYDLISQTAFIDNIGYPVNEEKYIPNTQELHGKRVFFLVQDNKIVHMDTMDRLTTPRLLISILYNAYIGNANIFYKNGNYNLDKLNARLHISFNCGYSFPDGYDLSVIYTDEKFDSIPDKVILHAPEWEVADSIYLENKGDGIENAELALGESIERPVILSPIPSYVPLTVNSQAINKCKITAHGNGTERVFENNGTFIINISNCDLQNQIGSSNKTNRDDKSLDPAIANEIKEISDKEINMILPPKLEFEVMSNAKQKKNLKKLIAIWMTGVALEVPETNLDDKIKDKAKEALKKQWKKVSDTKVVENGFKLFEFIELKNTVVQSRLTVKVNTIRGPRDIVLSYNGIQTGVKDNANGSLGTITWEDTDGIFTIYSEGDKGMVSMTDFKTFYKDLYSVAEKAIKNFYEKTAGATIDEISGYVFSNVTSKLINKICGKYSDGFFNLIVNPTKRLSIHCPVDVYVYNMDNVLCGSIVDDKPHIIDNGVIVYTENDTKYVLYSGDDYRIELTGTDDGTMDYFVEEFSPDDILLRTVTFNNIPLTNKISYTGSLPIESLTDSENYRLTSSENTTIYPDNDTLEPPVTLPTDDNPPVINTFEPAYEDGKINVTASISDNNGISSVVLYYSNGYTIDGVSMDRISSIWKCSFEPLSSSNNIKVGILAMDLCGNQSVSEIKEVVVAGKEPEYNIILPSSTPNGTISVIPTTAVQGTTISITAIPNANYKLDTLTVTDKDGNSITLEKAEENIYTFIMPASDVSINASFKLSSSSGSSSSPSSSGSSGSSSLPSSSGSSSSSKPSYTYSDSDDDDEEDTQETSRISAPTIYHLTAPTAEGGKIAISPKNPSAGDTVTLRATPDSGYKLNTLSVIRANGKAVRLTGNGGNEFTFVMPSSKVDISATFIQTKDSTSKNSVSDERNPSTGAC